MCQSPPALRRMCSSSRFDGAVVPSNLNTPEHNTTTPRRVKDTMTCPHRRSTALFVVCVLLRFSAGDGADGQQPFSPKAVGVVEEKVVHIDNGPLGMYLTSNDEGLAGGIWVTGFHRRFNGLSDGVIKSR